MSENKERVIVGLAAACLRQEGYDVHGLFMFNWDEDEEAYCTAADDYQDARSISDTLGIPLHRVDFSDEYRDRVFAYFLEEYQAGRTPNPDVLCNREIKFGVFFEYAKRLGAKYIATLCTGAKNRQLPSIIKGHGCQQRSELFFTRHRPDCTGPYIVPGWRTREIRSTRSCTRAWF